MKKKLVSMLLALVMMFSLIPSMAFAATTGKKIYLSPSDQTENSYAYGNTTEAIQCRRIADALEAALKRNGFQVKNNKTSSMQARVTESNKWGADLHIPLHTNAFNHSVSGTRIFTRSTSSTCKDYQCAKKIYNRLAPLTPGDSESISNNSSLYEIRNVKALSVYVETDFHDVKSVAKWIIEHTTDIGEAICKGVCDYYGVTYVGLTAPSITMGNRASDGKVSIQWPAVKAAAKYEIWRSTSSSGTYTKMYTTTDTKNYVNTSNATVGTAYYYKVRAIDAYGGIGPFCGAKCRTVACAQPVVAITPDNDKHAIDLTWKAVTGAAKYDVYRSTSADSGFTKLISTTGLKCHNTTDVKEDVTYYYKVIARGATSASDSAYSAVVDAKIVPAIATPVVTVTNSASTGRVVIKYPAVEGAAKYEIWRATAKDGEFTRIYSGTATSVTNTKNIAVGNMYWYKVRAVAENGDTSAFSAVKSRRMICAQPVITMSNVASTGRVHIEWPAVDGAAKYEIWRAPASDGEYTKMYTTAKTTYTNTTGSVGYTYFYKVKAIGTVEGSDSAFSKVGSRCVACARPTVTVSYDKSEQPVIAWETVTGAKSYNVYRAVKGSSDYELLGNTTELSLTDDSEVSAATTYNYKVMAVGRVEAGNSAMSSAIKATVTKLPVPAAS